VKLNFTLESGEELSFSVFERSVTIGRSINNRIVLPYETFSRQHCLIEFIDEEIIITDPGSANGVFINGERISRQVPTPLHAEDSLTIANAKVQILEDTSAPEIDIELMLSEHHQKDSTDSNLFQVRERRKPLLEENVAPKTTRLGMNRRKYHVPKPAYKKRAENSENFSLFDPVGIIVIVLMLGGFLFYKHRMNRMVKKAPPPYHKTYMVLED
jgi:hypothetical protein